MSREPEAVLFEAEYLKALNTDCGRLLDLVAAAAAAIAAQAGPTITLLPTIRGEAGMAALEAITGGMRDAMTTLSELQQVVIQHGETIGGRIRVVMDEMGVEPGAAE